MPRHALHPSAVLPAALLALALAGCGSSADDSATTAAGSAVTTEAGAGTTEAAAATTSTIRATTATTGGGAASTDSSATDSSGTVIEATVAGGKVDVAQDRFEVAKGADVVIRVTSDVAEPIHLHGYDIETEADPGQPAEIAFTATIPGVFEVELEDSGTLLFEIEVK